MNACPACGAAALAESQCPQCGSYVPGDAAPMDLDLDTEALQRRPARGVEAPSAAQIGGTGGDPALEVEKVERRPPRITRSLAEEAAGGFGAQERERRIFFWRVTRGPVVLILGWFTLSHLAFDSAWVFLDNVDLLLHEAGHVIWGWGSHTQAALGGTLGQLMWPAIFAAYFLRWNPDRFAMWCCIWWFGQNFMSISRYMDDAAVMELPLVGGDQHDWNYLFKRWDVLDKCNEIAGFFHGLGAVLMLGSLAWLAWRAAAPDRADVDKLD